MTKLVNVQTLIYYELIFYTIRYPGLYSEVHTRDIYLPNIIFEDLHLLFMGC